MAHGAMIEAIIKATVDAIHVTQNKRKANVDF
jgi:hypothetical protein